MEREYPDAGSRQQFIRAYDLLVNTTESANDIIERIEKRTFPKLEAVLDLENCEASLKTERPSG